MALLVDNHHKPSKIHFLASGGVVNCEPVGPPDQINDRHVAIGRIPGDVESRRQPRLDR